MSTLFQLPFRTTALRRMNKAKWNKGTKELSEQASERENKIEKGRKMIEMQTPSCFRLYFVVEHHFISVKSAPANCNKKRKQFYSILNQARLLSSISFISFFS
jgi:hypothetical protein